MGDSSIKAIPMAIVFPGCVDGFGGAESQALEFLRAYDKKSFEFDLVILGSNPSLAQRAREIAGLPVYELCPTARHVWSPAVMRAYVTLLRARRYRLVHLYGLRQEIVTRPCTKLFSSAVVVSAIRGTEDHRGFFHRIVNKLTSGFVDLWIANSNFARIVFMDRIGIPSENIQVVHNGVRTGELIKGVGTVDHGFVIGCVANQFPEKRIGDLISAVGDMIRSGIDAQLILVGRETEHTPVLQNLVERFSISDSVTFLGYRPDVAELMNSFDVLVLPSEKESFPSSLLEGMAHGLPIVAASTAGIPEMVLDGVTGFLYKVGDIEALRMHLEFVAADSELCRKMGRLGQKRVESEFSIPILVNSLTRKYLHLIDAKAGSQ